jgi:hypothetical protein
MVSRKSSPHLGAFREISERTIKNAKTFMESAFFRLFCQEKDGGQGWIRTSALGNKKKDFKKAAQRTVQ